VDECKDILLHCNILCSQLSFTANMKKKNPDWHLLNTKMTLRWYPEDTLIIPGQTRLVLWRSSCNTTLWRGIRVCFPRTSHTRSLCCTIAKHRSTSRSQASVLFPCGITVISDHGGHRNHGGRLNGLELPVLLQRSAQASSHAPWVFRCCPRGLFNLG
jgi:hypothetical protein